MPLHIVIDVRRVRDFGIGTYIRNLTRALSALDAENQYTLIAHPNDAGHQVWANGVFEAIHRSLETPAAAR